MASALERLRQYGKPAAPAGNAFKPIIQNPDGSFSTERTLTASFDEDGKEVFYNIPTIVNGKEVGEDEAIRLFQQGVNKPVGRFDSLDAAEKAAVARSEQIGVARGNEAKQLSALDRLRQYQPIAVQPVDTTIGPPADLAGRSLLDQVGAGLSAFGDYAVSGFADSVAGAARAIGEDPSLLTQAANPLMAIGRQTGLVARPPVDPNLLRFADEFSNPGRAQEAAATLNQAGIPEDSIAASLARGGGSVGNMAASIGAGLITRSPAVGALAAGAGSFGSAYEEGAGPDATVEERQRRATLQAGIEAAAERVGLGYILPTGLGGTVGRLAGATAPTRVLAAGAVGGSEEAATTALQMASDEALGYQDYSAQDYTRGLQDAAVAGTAFSAVARAGTLPADRRTTPVLPDTGDPAFDAGKDAAATLDTVADVQEAVQQPVTPKPRVRVVDGQLVPVDAPATTVAPPATVRVYHGGDGATDGNGGRWVTTQKSVAEGYAKKSNAPLWYVDLPANDPRVNDATYADQGVKQGFQFNFELTPEESLNLKRVDSTPFVDDSLVPADEADISAINQQLTTEQQRTQNAEARNRVVKELTSARDRTTATNIERLLGDGRITFYGDQATLPEGANSATDKGYFDGQRIYLNESKLGEGEATAVALHEIKHYMDQQAETGGQQINRRSLRQFIGNESNQRVNNRITELARTGNTIAKEALEDARFGATTDGQFNQAVFDDEVVPYFLQRMAAARSTGRPIVRRATEVVKDIISAAKARIADFGIDLNLTENDILYLGKQLVGEAAKAPAQNGQSRAQTGRATLVGPRAQNFQRYAEEGIVFRGALDNLPRAEIDDSKTSIRPEGKKLIQDRGSTFMGAFFNHPELYDNYPEMKRTRVRLFTPEEQKANPNIDGQAEAEDNTIAIHPRVLENENDLRRLLVHEGQHMIQEREGFIPGANPSEFMDPKDQQAFSRAKTNIESFLNTVDRGILNDLESRLPDSLRGAVPSKILNGVSKLDPSLNSYSREERAAIREYRALLGEYTPLLEKSMDAIDKYRRTGGEVEARTVENRIGLTAGERRETPFSESSERMAGGVRAADLVDNTNPASGSRFAGVRAAIRQKALSQGASAPPAGRASKSRPEQPERVRKRLAGEGVTQPTSRRAPVPTQARGVVPERASERFVEEKTTPNAERSIVSKLKVAGDAALSAVAPSTRGKATDVNEIMERSLGEAVESKVRAAQSLNLLEKSVNRVPKTERNAVKRQLALASNSDPAIRNSAIESLKKTHPAVYANYDSMRNQIRQWGLDAIVSIRDSGKQLTKKDVAVITKILKNLDSYVTRTYRVDFKGPIAEQLKKDTLGAWSKGDRASEGAKAFEEARLYLRDTLQIGAMSGTKAKKPADYDFESLEQLEARHAEWVSRENAPTLFADATDQQRETYINTLLSDLQRVRKEMPEAEYLQKLDDKALRLTKELIDTVNTNSSKLVQFFRGARQDNTIVSTRSDVPEPIRKLWGEVTEPTAALAITMMRQGEFLARQKMLRELYDIGLGRYFVDQKDARSDVFTERLQGETFGPLDGMYATPSFKQAVESNIEPLNSWRKVFEAMSQGKADIATQAAAGQAVAFLSSAGSFNKKMTVVANPASWVNNFLGGPATPIMQGFVPGDGLARGVKAARDLIGPSFNERLSPEAQRVLKANLQESGQVGEIQQAQKDIIQNLLLESGALERFNRLGRKANDKAVDAYAMTDVVWKLSSFFAKVDWLKDYYKAKGVTRTAEQIDREAAEYVKSRAITFSRAAPLVKFTERLGVTSYAPYFYETYRTLAASLLGAAKYIQDGRAEGGPAGAMKARLGIRAAVGATSALFYNRAILPAYEVAGAVALAGLAGLGAMEPPDEEEQAKLDIIRKGMSDFYVGKELTLWRKTEDGKYIFIEPGRVNPNDPATSPMAALMSGDPETALKAISGLFFGNQGIAAILGVGQEVLTDSKAKKPSSAYQTPDTYEAMVDALQNSGVSDPTTTAQVTRVLEKYVPKVLRTTLREATEDTGLTGSDKFLAAMGQPFAIFDPKKDIRMSGFRDYNDPVDKAKEDFKTVITTRNPSDEVIKDAYLRSLKMEHKAYTRMREVVEAAKAAGASNQEISGILKDENGLNKAQISSLISGRFQPTFISPASVSNSRKEEIKADSTKAPQVQSKYTRIDRIIRQTNNEFKELLEESN